MRTEPTIRVGRVSDAENLAALAIQVWLHTYATEGVSSAISRYVLAEFTAKKFQALIQDPETLILVAEVNSHLIGYALVKFNACGPSTRSTTEVATLYVQEHFVRKGVGTALLTAVQDEVRQRTGTSCLWLTVNAQNTGAIAFYRNLGFAQEGITYFELGGERHENYVLVGPNV